MSTLVAADVALILDTVLEGEHQYDGAGRIGAPDFTVAQCLRIITAYCAANGTGLDSTNGTAAIMSLDGILVRIAATMANGNRAVTSRNGA